MSKFSVAGVSTQHGITKVRFANDIVSRTKVLAKGGHVPLELIELPELMDKAEACQYLLDRGGVFAQTMGKKLPAPSKVTKAPTAKAAPAKVAKPVAKQVKISKPKVVEDLEVTEIKSLAEAMQEPATV